MKNALYKGVKNNTRFSVFTNYMQKLGAHSQL